MDTSPEFEEKLQSLFSTVQSALKYDDYLSRQPHIVTPGAETIFERMLAQCDKITKEFSGEIRAEINYSTYEASIVMLLPLVEFINNEFMSFLTELTHTASLIRFSPLTNGALRFEINMPYFRPLEPPQSFDSFLAENPIE